MHHHLLNTLSSYGSTPQQEEITQLLHSYHLDKRFETVLFGLGKCDKLRDRDIHLKLALLDCDIYPSSERLEKVKEAIVKDKQI